jgi:hypothetical protein
MKSHSSENVYLEDTITLQKVMINLGANALQVKKYTKKYNIPYIKIGHRWRFTKDSYELLKQKLTHHGSDSND